MKISMCSSVLKTILARVAATGMARRLLTRHTAGLASVFLLHRAAGVYDGICGYDPRQLEKIIIDLKKHGFNLVSLHQVVEAAQGKGALPGESIAFTIDDGYRDQVEVIAPIFIKYEVPATVFLTTGFLNNEMWPWDAKIHWLIHEARQSSIEIQFGRHRLQWPLGNKLERLATRRELQAICANLPGAKIDRFLHTLEKAVGTEIPEHPPKQFSPATWEQVRQLEDSGISFAPHTHSHRVLSRLQEAEVRTELGRSLAIVMAETRSALPVLAYPVGMERQFGLREMRIAEESGYSAAFAVLEDYARWRESRVASGMRYRLGRFGLPHSASDTLWLVTGLQSLENRITGAAKPYSMDTTFKHSLFASNLNSLKMVRMGLTQRLVYRLRLASGHYDSLRQLQVARIERFVFVCRGNVCRSPFAEAAMKAHGFSAISCGVDVSRCVPAESMAVRAALLQGQDISQHISQSIFNIPLVRSDCLVAMDPSHLPVAQDVADRMGCQITLIGLWRKAAVPEIADPYNKTLPTYLQCFNEIDEALTGLLYEMGGHGKRT